MATRNKMLLSSGTEKLCIDLWEAFFGFPYFSYINQMEHMSDIISKNFNRLW